MYLCGISAPTPLEHLKIAFIFCNGKVTTLLFSAVFETTLLSHCNTAYSLHSNCVSFLFFSFFFLVPKCKLFPATLQDFSPLMIWKEITTHSADRGKSTRISNTTDTE